MRKHRIRILLLFLIGLTSTSPWHYAQGGSGSLSSSSINPNIINQPLLIQSQVTWYVGIDTDPCSQDPNPPLTCNNSSTPSSVPFCKIQQAVDAAKNNSTYSKFILKIHSGTYHENVKLTALWPKNIVFERVQGCNEVVIDGDTNNDNVGDGPVFSIDTHATFSNLTIQDGNNQGIYGGGGIYIVPSGSNLPNVSIQNCLIKKNEGKSGGGITVIRGQVSIKNSIIRENRSNGYGAGLLNVDNNPGTVTVENSTIEQNGPPDPNNVANQGGGITNGGVMVIDRTTVSGNVAEYGGGIYDVGDSLSVINSTISGNQSMKDGGGLNIAGTAKLKNVTIMANKANVDVASSSFGGGIVQNGQGPVTLQHVILAGNIDEGPQDPKIPDCLGSLTTEGFNILGNSTGCNGILNGKNGDKVGVDPLLGPLQYNGGTSKTHAPLQGSPAIGGGNPADQGGCKDLSGNTLIQDQRGQPRSGACDIGSVGSSGCGNGKVDGSEECDDGNNVNTDACLLNCKNASCGDNKVWAGQEECDDGNQTSGDGTCQANCKNPKCGDGIVDPGEGCDDGNTVDNDSCTNACKLPTCGDGIVQAGEDCDDTNNVDTDSCLPTCKNASCGDGKVWAGQEECDDNNQVNGDGCQANCKNPKCGDQIVDTGESCDDGNTDNTDDCLDTCFKAGCGDGFVWAGHEACDDKNNADNDACTNACKLPTCGDGIVQAGESCDDKNADNLDGCLNSCLKASCGDGFVQSGVEQCDDGNKAAGDGCGPNCQKEANSSTTPGSGGSSGGGEGSGGGDGSIVTPGTGTTAPGTGTTEPGTEPIPVDATKSDPFNQGGGGCSCRLAR